jgi:hypothetical protein
MNNTNIGFWNNTTLSQTSGFSYATNTWLHLALTKSGNDFKLFCNGIERLATTVTSTASNGNLIIGGDTARSDYINGRIDNVSVHETTLTATQVLNIFNAQKSRFGL